MDKDEQYDFFLAALRGYLDRKGHGEKTKIANEIEVSASLITQATKHPPTKKLGMENQISIGKKISGSYEAFVKEGMRIIKGGLGDVIEFESETERRHFNIIRNKFKDKDTACTFNSYLAELEELDLDKYESLLAELKIYVKKKRDEKEAAGVSAEKTGS